MQFRTGNEIREMFQRFFEERGHRRVHSSSLVPANDTTLLFTNAGMNQFKDVFLGLEQRPYNRATSSQKCVRAGGKHNDLENVGFTRRHHTFFEMLGNFSFGDYFKADAIAYAWELVTSPEWFGIPKDRLYVTIFKGENGVPRDAEAYDLWRAQGVPAERIFEMGAKDNFWQMGETGPCGPCSEIFYDMGIEAAETPGVNKPFPEDDQRYVEIWNLVFMQFDRSLVAPADQLSPIANGGHPERSEGSALALEPRLDLLPKPSIDTGAGLERLAAVLQGKLSNYDTDLFTSLLNKAGELTGRPYIFNLPKQRPALSEAEYFNASLRIIADHSRAATFLIADGVSPSNEGRGYVLRKIIRRAIQHGRVLGQRQLFLSRMAFTVKGEMATAYPELSNDLDRVVRIIEAEERQFARILEAGVDRMQEEFEKARSAPGFINNQEALKDAGLLYETFSLRPVLSGARAFYLHETHGLPLDFMMDAARDAGIDFDLTGFEQARAEEQARARASWKGGAKQSASPAYRDLAKTVFEGYTQLTSTNCEVLAIVKNSQGIPAANPGDEVEIVLDHTSF